jgi:hypothetical protein
MDRVMKRNVLKILDIILCVLILVSLCFIISASASTTNVRARFYVHVVEDIDPSTWGSKPQSSNYYFPSAGHGLQKSIVKPTPSDATNDGYSGKYHWYT